jgi:hypothetical protein
MKPVPSILHAFSSKCFLRDVNDDKETGGPGSATRVADSGSFGLSGKWEVGLGI